jgi:hypothetical protein
MVKLRADYIRGVFVTTHFKIFYVLAAVWPRYVRTSALSVKCTNAHLQLSRFMLVLQELMLHLVVTSASTVDFTCQQNIETPLRLQLTYNMEL